MTSLAVPSPRTCTSQRILLRLGLASITLAEMCIRTVRREPITAGALYPLGELFARWGWTCYSHACPPLDPYDLYGRRGDLVE